MALRVTHGATEAAALLRVIGPQRPDEPLLARRVRFHQSWYRVAVLGLRRYGNTEGRAPRPLGSVLADADSLDGRNFTSLSAQRLYERRRLEGWGVDPVRCTKYLTSSQTLTLNLLGPLEESPAWAVRVLSDVLDRSDIDAVRRLWVEYAPRRRSEYLHDMTRIDALVHMRTTLGDELLAVETKYSDRFNSRRVDVDKQPHKDLAASVEIWRDPDTTLQTAEVNQLVRCHALALALSRDMTGRTSTPGLLVLHHDDDAASRSVVDGYGAHLHDPALARAVRLGDFVAAVRRTATSPGQREAARALELRYVAECESEAAWQASDDRSVRATRGGGRPGSKR